MYLKKTLEELYPESKLNIKSVEHGDFIKVIADGKTRYYIIDGEQLHAFEPNSLNSFKSESIHYRKFKSLFRELVLNKLGI